MWDLLKSLMPSLVQLPFLFDSLPYLGGEEGESERLLWLDCQLGLNHDRDPRGISEGLEPSLAARSYSAE